MTQDGAGVTLVLGGARSGKSRYAEALCRAAGGERIYIATAEARDAEMRERVAQHKAERVGDGWRTIEETMDLAGVLMREAGEGRVLLVDCLTLWLTNHLLAGSDIGTEIDGLTDAVSAWPGGRLVLVANEVGYGIVPENRLARQFRDHAGRLNQRIAAAADEVTLVVAGLPVSVKGG
ncbi:MAG: bifunctional adenosylcobinamide kinase/adenosylcobinamide-phosphate guanylyltransferase [Nisaea sp.]|uniref:bifunctional adenosylcobinamide kinase/adenosylcobinamide-phosphate guanylyltransferase n=1 Tax=Nisaea sp. TaxID=2024842 RepID=UPI001B2C304C|nr:bifunctional adenosylcobinamide kinase/adenosylcobinamide-phosphate guanylyltransferase [Nisaea sp.]MBO6559787.1 bifunctional adenosylcobinamide kinase/adenosylcobinamide-phosphate guanylyltransferase [Nisaea sp.]